jgi:hypothetical protein
MSIKLIKIMNKFINNYPVPFIHIPFVISKWAPEKSVISEKILEYEYGGYKPKKMRKGSSHLGLVSD